MFDQIDGHGISGAVEGVLKKALKLMNFAFKMVNFVSKLMNFVLKQAC